MGSPIGHYEKIRALASTPRLLALGGVRTAAASRISVLDLASGKVARTFDLPSHVLALAFADATLLVAACLDGSVRFLETSSGAESRKLDAHRGGATAISIAGNRIATAGADGFVRLWQLADGKKLSEFQLSTAALRAVALDPDGGFVAGAGDDGVVHSIALTNNNEKRDMPGHDGPVRALAFTPRDGRLASAGDDGTIRIWYLVGDTEFEVRGEKDTGHAGGVTALLFPPIPPARADGTDPGDRLFSAGADGKVKVWRLEDKRRPKTLDAGDKPLYALAFIPSAAGPTREKTGAVVFGGDRRLVHMHLLDGENAPADKGDTFGHGFDLLTRALAGDRPGREQAVKTLAELDEHEALELLTKTLEKDKEPEVRALCAREIASHGRKAAHGALKGRLDDEHPIARMGAYDALLVLDKDNPLLALKAALKSKHADVRSKALPSLTPMRQSSPLVHGWIADRVADHDAGVRRIALEQLLMMSTSGPLDPLKLGYERGPADIKTEVLVRALVSGILSARGFADVTARALDDADGNVRRTAFAGKILERPALAAAIEARDQDLARTAQEVVRRVAFLKRPVDARPLPEVSAPSGGSMVGSRWPGRIYGPGEEYKFILVFDKYENGELHGTMEWPGYGTLAVKGTYKGNELDFVDYKVVKGTGQVGDKKHVTISGDTMSGTDRGGAIKFEAKREGTAQVAANEKPAKGAPVAPVTDAEMAAARASIPAAGSKVAGAQLTDGDLEPLLTAMACRTPDTALRGARGLAALGDTRALGALLQLSRESDPNLRREAASSLAALSDPRAKKRLAWMLDDGDAGVRASALESYSKLEGAAPLGSAGAALRSAQVDIRTRGLDTLVKLPAGGRGPEAEQMLEDALEDESPKVRAEAFRALWSWHDKDVQGAIDRAQTARFPDLRLKAVQELAARSAEAWAMPKLRAAISDRDLGVAKAAYDAVTRIAGKADAGAHLAAMESQHATLRATGAAGCREIDRADKATLERVRSPLMKLLLDEQAAVRTASIDTLAWLLPDENGPLLAGFQSGFHDLKIRAAEHLALRHDEQILETLRVFLTDKDLERVCDKATLEALRVRAASALATLGSSRNVVWSATVLLKSENPSIREQASRAMANGARRGDATAVAHLLDALGHADPWVRSWASDGLARLGDARSLPVLTGNLKAEHLPIRVGAILSFAALGPDGYGGMLQGLEDPSKEVQEALFAVVMARDLRAFRKGEAPDLLASALASARAEVRYSAARALELRVDPASYLEQLCLVLQPAKPDRQADMKDWPAEDIREQIVVALAEALAGEVPEQRYAAAQVLLLVKKPVEFFREASRVAKPRSLEKPWQPDNTPRAPSATDTVQRPQRLRKLFAGDGPAPADVADAERARLKWLAFGAYVGLLRQATEANDEANRVRRDATERVVELCLAGAVSATAALPALTRALDDKNQLVRKAAYTALKKIHPNDPDAPLSLALSSTSPDIARAALDELAARGFVAKDRIAAALDAPLADVRRSAFETLEKLYAKDPAGKDKALEPLLFAMKSEFADLRTEVVERLAASNDPRASDALAKAMESDHEDLRLRAAELVARRKDDHAINVLGGFLRHDDAATRTRALEAMVLLGSFYSAEEIGKRLEEAGHEEAATLLEAIGRMRRAESIAFVAARTDDEHENVRSAAFDAALTIAGDDREKRDPALAMTFLAIAIRSRDAGIRARAAGELDHPADPVANTLLAGLFSDRDKDVRVAAVAAYSTRVQQKSANPAPLERVLLDGARELMLAAAEGVASKQLGSALRPLLLFARAGEDEEKPRAALALGSLGDLRALPELELFVAGGTEEAPVPSDVKAASIEALGRIAGRITDPDTRARVVETVDRESRTDNDDFIAAAARALGAIGGEKSRVRLEQIAADEDHWDARRSAVVELSKLGDPASEKVLSEALSADDDDTRAAARKGLERMFPKDRSRIELLCATKSSYDDINGPAVTWLSNDGAPAAIVPKLPEIDDDDLRGKLRRALIRRGAFPANELGALLLHEQAKAREDAAAIAGAGARVPEGPKTTPAELTSLANALAGAERKAAAGWASKEDDDEKTEEESAWRMAFWAAAAIGARAIAPSATVLLTGGTASAPSSVRREAARALGVLGSAADVPALTAALTDADATVRVAAASALATLDPGRSGVLAQQPRPTDPLSIGATPGPIPSADSVAGWRVALPGFIAKKDIATLADLAVRASDANLRLDAVAAIAAIGGDAAVSALRNIAAANGPAKSDEALRRAAWRSLKRAQRKLATKRSGATS